MSPGLEGVKVIDMSQVAAVPMCARHLADFGADVIHVEHPVKGDFWRTLQTGQATANNFAKSDIPYLWENYNRNKRGVTVDVSQESGQSIIYRMVEQADVFLTNMRPFELEKYRLEYDVLSQINSRLIYGSLTGYGKKGPEKNEPGYDGIAFWTRAGIAHRLASYGNPPPEISPAFGDNLSGLALFAGIMTALFIRERTGIGQEVDLSLYNMGVYQLTADIAGSLITGLDCESWKRKSREEAPNALALRYQTKDGRWLRFAMNQPDRYWSKFCQAIERPDLEHDPRFASFEPRIKNHIELIHILDEVMLTRTLNEWKTRLSGIPFDPLQNLTEVTGDPQARANDFFIPFDHPKYGRMEVINNPIKLSQTQVTIRMPAPEFGQHTEEVLLEYGYTWEDIARFKEQGTIA